MTAVEGRILSAALRLYCARTAVQKPITWSFVCIGLPEEAVGKASKISIELPYRCAGGTNLGSI